MLEAMGHQPEGLNQAKGAADMRSRRPTTKGQPEALSTEVKGKAWVMPPRGAPGHGRGRSEAPEPATEHVTPTPILRADLKAAGRFLLEFTNKSKGCHVGKKKKKDNKKIFAGKQKQPSSEEHLQDYERGRADGANCSRTVWGGQTDEDSG